MITKPTIAFYTLGCRLNQSETAVIQKTFEHNGYTIVDLNAGADIVIVNTCTVTENGDADTRRLVNKINRLNPKSRIALIGCQAQVQKEKLLDLPNVKWVVGNAKKFDLVSILKELADDEQTHVIMPSFNKESFTVPLAGIDDKHTRANIKIQDGCDFFCSFCEIPFARGRARSREFSDIIKEVTTLAAAGHKEVVITGINVGTYGNDHKTILDVICALENIPDLKRIRISSIEPTTIPKEFFTKMSQDNKLCRYLHIPLQSGHDDILSAMKRKYTYEQFNEFIEHARSTVPDICIGTDVIVGFPGETDEHFRITEERLREAPIDYFHIFSYSKRNVAPSRHLTNEVPSHVISQRSEILRDLSLRKRRVFQERFIDCTIDVLFEEEKDGYWTGLTDNYLRVNVRSDKNLANEIFPVHIFAIEKGQLVGTLVSLRAEASI